MKKCIYCDNEVEDYMAFCPHCGYKILSDDETDTPEIIIPHRLTGAQKTARFFMVLTIVFVICVSVLGILACIKYNNIIESEELSEYEISEYRAEVTESSAYSVVYALSLIYIVPMTIYYFKATKRGERVSIAFNVCTLIFVCLWAGIAMFCDRRNN